MATDKNESFKNEMEEVLDVFIDKRGKHEQPEQQEAEVPAHAQTEAAPIPTAFKFERKQMEVKSKRLQLVLKPSLFKKVKAKAKENGLSVNEFCHQVLEQVTRH